MGPMTKLREPEPVSPGSAADFIMGNENEHGGGVVADLKRVATYLRRRKTKVAGSL